MKVTEEDRTRLLNACIANPVWERCTWAQAKEEYASLSVRRFRWDLYWSTLKGWRDAQGDRNAHLFPSREYNDNHIDTALRWLVRQMEERN